METEKILIERASVFVMQEGSKYTIPSVLSAGKYPIPSVFMILFSMLPTKQTVICSMHAGIPQIHLPLWNEPIFSGDAATPSKC